MNVGSLSFIDTRYDVRHDAHKIREEFLQPQHNITAAIRFTREAAPFFYTCMSLPTQFLKYTMRDVVEPAILRCTPPNIHGKNGADSVRHAACEHISISHVCSRVGTNRPVQLVVITWRSSTLIPHRRHLAELTTHHN